MATELESLTGDLPTDPDAQATVTDFLDYTEYLPSDLVRSLRLIGNLDESYLNSADKVHNLLKVYGSLPNLSEDKRPSSQYLRHQISYNLDQAINARESSFAEASRLYDQVDRHYNRLTSIITKLHALPKPPSRDPTPVAPARSPQLSRTRKADVENTPAPRITLRIGDQKVTSSGRIANIPKSSHRSRKVTVPGEVLPPPNPDSPPPVSYLDWDFPPPSPVPVATSRVGAPSRSRPSQRDSTRVQKSPKPPKPQKVNRPPKLPGQMGTNVHSAVAGISTSNALSLLEPPPPDAKPGTSHAPWMRLTEWEMAKLRKRMKKNAIWSPSETMIRRELADAGRGPENYRAVKAQAMESGEPFIDEDNIATSTPGKPLAPGEISADSLSVGDTNLSNRGMKLNEAKKQKRELLAREQAALAAAEAELAAKRLGDIGSSFKSLFTKSLESAPASPLATVHQINGTATLDEKKKVRDRSKEKERAKEREREKAKAREKEKQEELEKKKERERRREKERAQDEEEEKEREKEREKEEEHEKKREEVREKEAEAEKARLQQREHERKRAQEEEEETQKEKRRQAEEAAEREREEERKQQEEKDRVIEKQKDLEKEAARISAKKRKRDATPAQERSEQRLEPSIQVDKTSPTSAPAVKKRRAGEIQPLSPILTTTTTTTKVPLAPPAPSPPRATATSPATPIKEPPAPIATSTRSRRVSLTLKGPAPPQPPATEPAKPSSRSASRSSSRRASVGPPSTPIRSAREKLPRKSATPAPSNPVRTAASRRSKRPAPGPVTEDQEGGPAVSVGKRKAAPKKKATAVAAGAARKAAEGNAKAQEEETRLEEEAAGDEIDPDEPRYCLCGDVSWGDMICCENAEVGIPLEPPNGLDSPYYRECFDGFR